MKKLSRVLLYGLIFSIQPPAFAQKEHSVWHFGLNAGLHFDDDTVTSIAGGQINSREGCASISGRTSGELLFYTDGSQVWDRTHTPMKNGKNLNGDYSSAQSAIIIPFPNDTSKYYLFTTATAKGMYYSVVDMTLNSGKGDVIASTKNTRLLKAEESSEKLCAVKHDNDVDFWVITHLVNGDDFYVYSVTGSGVSEPSVYSLGATFKVGGWMEAAQLKVSPDGKKLANAIGPMESGAVSDVEIMNFNNKTGKISGPLIILDELHFPYGVEFSPNGRFLYVSELAGSKLYQYDLENQDDVNESALEIYASGNLQIGSLQLGPDGRIYVCGEKGYNTGYAYLSVVSNPDEPGEKCGFLRNHIKLSPGKTLIGLPSIYTRKYEVKLVERVQLPEPVKPALRSDNKVGDLIVLKGIFYGLDSANIYTRPESMKVLDTLANVLKRLPNLTIELGSHTDCRNTMEYNQRLSQRRADSAKAYLVSHGVESERITTKGYGETQLKIAKCACEGVSEREQSRQCTEPEHDMNRRTEIKITGVDYKPKAPGQDKKPAPGATPPGTPGGGSTKPPE